MAPPLNAFATAVHQFRQGEHATALELIEQILLDDPDAGKAWELKGLILRSSGEWATACEALEQATMLTPLQPIARCVLAECHAGLGRRSLAIEMLQMLLEDLFTPTPLLLRVASGLDQLGQPTFALAACREASRREPDVAQYYYEMGYYMGRCGQALHLVESVARRAIALDPRRVSYRVGLASLLSQQQRADEAWRLLAKLTAADIGQITCRCCVDRVLGIYEAVGDKRRALLCRQRQRQLAMATDETHRAEKEG